MSDTSSQLPQEIRERVENLFVTGRMACAPAVLLTLNQGLGGELTPELAERLTIPFTHGMGGGCTCGGLVGAQLAMGLFLSKAGTGGYWDKRTAQAAKELHDAYREIEGAVCCRILNKPGKLEPADQKKSCTNRVGAVTERAAKIILDARPELAAASDGEFLQKREGRARALVKRALAAVLG